MLQILPMVILTLTVSTFYMDAPDVLQPTPSGNKVYIFTEETPLPDDSTLEIESLKRRIEDLENDVAALQTSLHSVTLKLLEEKEKAQRTEVPNKTLITGPDGVIGL